MKKPSLVILAAGMGTRYGGLKQMDAIGPNGESLLEFSIFDAIRAGFEKVVFIIREDFKDAFEEKVGNKISKYAQVEYAYQATDKIPAGFSFPNREKPWGTAHALACAADKIDEDFVILNADDFYGKDAFDGLYNFLTTDTSEDNALMGYVLAKTLTDNGSVARGVCAEKDGYLVSIDERTKIQRNDGQTQYLENDVWHNVDENSLVSMNMWGLRKSFLDEVIKELPKFLENVVDGDQKAEFFLPKLVDQLIKENKVNVRVLSSTSKWYGVTYQEDKEDVRSGIQKLIEEGVYPENLWK